MGHVRCGRCMACRLTKAADWSARILHEFHQFDYSGCFVTLTYNDESLPPGGNLVKKDLQNFIKRLRKDVAPLKIKYFACGEYGEDPIHTKRPHYHAIILGIRPYQKQVIEDAWSLYGTKKGHVVVGSVTDQSINYTTKYITKKLGGLQGQVEYGTKTPPFQIQSQGMGLQWANENYTSLEETGKITIKGRPSGIPKYYKQKLDLSTTHLEEYIEEQREATLLEYIENGITPLGQADYSRAKRQQIGRNLRARSQLQKSKI